MLSGETEVEWACGCGWNDVVRIEQLEIHWSVVLQLFHVLALRYYPVYERYHLLCWSD
jgi:hypothetical protein